MKLINWTIDKEGPEQILAAVQIPKGSKMTRKLHREAWISRVQYQIDQAEDPKEEARMMERRLNDLGILGGQTQTRRGWEAYDLLYDNPILDDYLGTMEFQDQIPGLKVTKDNKVARAILESEKEAGVEALLEALGA